MALVVGLDIGTRAIKGAVLAGTSKKLRLVDYFQVEVPALEAPTLGRPEGTLGRQEGAAPGEAPTEYVPPMSLEELISKTLADRNLKAADVIAAIDSKDCVIREITVPFTRDEQIRRTVPFEAENYFHAFDIDEVILEYVKTEEVEGKSRLILVALRKSLIESRLGLLKRAGYDPLAIDLDGAALANAFAASQYHDPAKTVLIVDMGATSTKIVLVDKGRLKKVRSLRTGAAVLGPERLIAEPAAVGHGAAAGAAGGGGLPEAGDEGESFGLEARFQEIEAALRRLEPISGLEGESEADEGTEGVEAPIAILPDDEYDRLREAGLEDLLEGEAGAGMAGGRGAGGAPGATAGGTGFAPEAGAARGAFPGRRSLGGNGAGLNYGDYLERIGVEIQRTFATTHLSSPIELICLTGGMSAREEARRFFNDSFDVETVALEFGDVLSTDLEPHRMQEAASGGAVAIGLALKGLGRDEIGIDFRKGPFRYEHRFERLKYPLLACSFFALLLFLQTAFWGFHRYDYQSKRAAGFAAESAKLYKAFFDKEPVAGRAPLEAARAQRKTWEGKGHSEVDRFVDVVAALRDFGEIMRESGFFFKVQNIDFDFRVKSVPGGANKKPTLRGQPSSVTLLTEDSRGGQTLQEKFRAKSKYFQAKSEARTVQKEYRITLNLEFKPQALAQLE